MAKNYFEIVIESHMIEILSERSCRCASQCFSISVKMVTIIVLSNLMGLT